MTTITAKELRENLSTIIDRVEHGEDVRVIRRSKPSIRLTADQPKSGNSRELMTAIGRYQARLQQAGITPKTNPRKPIKELYRQAMDNDPKYARYVTKTTK